MKNIKLFLAVIALLVFPFFAKAQFSCPTCGISMTVTYIDHGYGPLSATATSSGHSYPYTITNGTSHTFTSTDASWMSLGFSAAGITVMPNPISTSILEGQNINEEVGYNYVPKSPSGTAPIFTVKRTAPYTYTVTTWLIPQ